MADYDKDIFSKADALLRRGVAPPADGSETGSVPVLTDIVETPDGEPPPPREVMESALEALEPLEPLAALEPQPEPELPTEAQITRQVIDRVLAEVEQRLAADLEHRVLEHLTPQVHAAVASALGDLHQELANAIGDAITQALERRPVK